jgi:hypothetical protein
VAINNVIVIWHDRMRANVQRHAALDAGRRQLFHGARRQGVPL